MKRFLLSIALFGITYYGFAQRYNQIMVTPKTRHKTSTSGFGSPMIELSAIKGQPAFSVGGGGAALFNEQFFLGGFRQQTVTNTPVMAGNTSYNLQLNQGGLWAGYMSHSSKLITLQADTRFGWATIGVRRGPDKGVSYQQTSFMVTPALGAQINASSFFRINVSGGYRFATGAALPLTDAQGRLIEQLTNRNLGGLVGSISFLFGGF